MFWLLFGEVGSSLPLNGKLDAPLTSVLSSSLPSSISVISACKTAKRFPTHLFCGLYQGLLHGRQLLASLTSPLPKGLLAVSSAGYASIHILA